MSRPFALPAVALATALSCAVAMAADTPLPSAADPHPAAAGYGLAPSGDYALIDAGAQAPDFTFEATGGWTRLHDLRAQGNVLLLFCPDDEQLVALERERPRLLAMGVVPVAVLDRRPTSCRALASRLRLGFTLASDSRRVIGAQFNAIDPESRADAPAWFVIGRDGRVRDLAHESWPEHPWTEVCSSALGLPGPGAPVPASFRH